MPDLREHIRILKDSAGVKLSGVAKTASFNSEKFKPKGSTIGLLLDIGTVTGSTPVMAIKAQLSMNNGVTWLDTFPADINSETQWTFANITGSKETMEYVRVPSGFEGFGGTTINPVMRWVFTLTGTSPSFTFTNAWIVEGARAV